MAKTVETVNRASNTLLGLTPEDVERYSKAAVAKEFDSVSSLPNHLQYFEYDIIYSYLIIIPSSLVFVLNADISLSKIIFLFTLIVLIVVGLMIQFEAIS